MINKKWDYKKCNDIKKSLLNMNLTDEETNFIINQIKNRDEHIEALCKHNEIKNRTCVPINKRKLIVEHTNTQSTKLTINPCDGKVSLKISDKITSEQIKEDFINIAKQIMKFDFSPTTHRGKISFNHSCVCYNISLSSESKRFNRRFVFNKDKKIVEILKRNFKNDF